MFRLCLRLLAATPGGRAGHAPGAAVATAAGVAGGKSGGGSTSAHHSSSSNSGGGAGGSSSSGSSSGSHSVSGAGGRGGRGPATSVVAGGGAVVASRGRSPGGSAAASGSSHMAASLMAAAATVAGPGGLTAARRRAAVTAPSSATTHASASAGGGSGASPATVKVAKGARSSGGGRGGRRPLPFKRRKSRLLTPTAPRPWGKAARGKATPAEPAPRRKRRIVQRHRRAPKDGVAASDSAKPSVAAAAAAAAAGSVRRAKTRLKTGAALLTKKRKRRGAAGRPPASGGAAATASLAGGKSGQLAGDVAGAAEKHAGHRGGLAGAPAAAASAAAVASATTTSSSSFSSPSSSSSLLAAGAATAAATAAASSSSSSSSSPGAAGSAQAAVGAIVVRPPPIIATTAEIREMRKKKKSFLMKRRIRKWPGGKKLRVCVLNSSYAGTDSVTAAHDNYVCTPAHYIKSPRYAFHSVEVHKNDSYRRVRELVSSGAYDVFFNLCDGGRDEKRAGVDVVEALEEFNAAFTGTDSRSFEPSKIDMKLMVGAAGVKTPNFVLLHRPEGLAKKCRHLRFPVIVKHLSGYASVGISKDSRCDTLEELKAKVASFLQEYNHALVEEFIRGREGTVLTCADSNSLHGVKVFRPLMFNFLSGADDFAYFEKKWTVEFNDDAYGFLSAADPCYPKIVESARNAFKFIMNGVGYGRVDFRVDERGEVYFLEINPNCGMWYSEKDGGDFADLMVQGDSTWDHERFVENACERAVREQAARRPWFFISHDANGNFSTRASRTVPMGKCLFGDLVHPIPVIAKALYKLGEDNPTVGCVILRGDGTHRAVAIRHSCEPNMQLVHGCTLSFAAKRQINVGEELTVDYATLRDEKMPRFACSCGTINCRSVIFAMPAMPRTVEPKAMKRLLREKKQLWLKEQEEAEAERMLKKRSTNSPRR